MAGNDQELSLSKDGCASVGAKRGGRRVSRSILSKKRTTTMRISCIELEDPHCAYVAVVLRVCSYWRHTFFPVP